MHMLTSTGLTVKISSKHANRTLNFVLNSSTNKSIFSRQLFKLWCLLTDCQHSEVNYGRQMAKKYWETYRIFFFLNLNAGLADGGNIYRDV